MRRILSMISLASMLVLTASCGSKEAKDGEQGKGEGQQTFDTEEALTYTELKKEQLPCDKDSLYNAWKRIGTIELQRRKTLDYKQHTPTLFIAADLDQDGNTEVLLRGESPYAAIFTVVNDSIRLITFVDQAQMGLAITQDGTILRNGIDSGGASVSEFIKLKQSSIDATGATRETFVIRDGAMVSEGTQYMLGADTGMVKVSQKEFQKVVTKLDGTYFEDIDGWEDFRKP